MRKLKTSLLLIALFIVGVSTARAQVDRATLSGTVTDPSGAIVSGAKIEAVSITTGLHRETTTGAEGSYRIPGLPIGSYKITISKQGFKPLQFEQVTFSAGDASTLDAHLQVGPVSEQ